MPHAWCVELLLSWVATDIYARLHADIGKGARDQSRWAGVELGGMCQGA